MSINDSDAPFNKNKPCHHFSQGCQPVSITLFFSNREATKNNKLNKTKRMCSTGYDGMTSEKHTDIAKKSPTGPTEKYPKKTCLKHLQSLNATMIDLRPKVLAACVANANHKLFIILAYCA